MMKKPRLALGLLLVSVVAGTATGSINRASSAPPEAQSGPAAAGDSTRPQAGDPLGILEPCAVRYKALVDRGYEPRSLVALLPDPVDSRYHREFDLLLGAARRALESEPLQFLQDRHCLPWSVAPDSNRASGRHREAPGVILFRRDPASTEETTTSGEVLALYLVGEIPAWGVQTGALRLALELSADGLASGASPASDGGSPDIRLLGPTFSGSTRSLAVALKAWHDERVRDNRPAPTFTIVSGTATSPSNPQVFRNTLGKAASYRSTVTDDDILQNCLWNRFVPGRLGLRTGTQTPGEAAPDSNAVAILVERSHYKRWPVGRGFLFLSFPKDISLLRAAHEREDHRQAPNGEAMVEAQLSSNLPFMNQALDNQLSTLDQFPIFDPKSTSRTQLKMLDAALGTLKSHQIEVVALATSNLADTIFLAERVRIYAPEVRLITFAGDQLLADPEFIQTTLGMLVVSSNLSISPHPFGAQANDLYRQFESEAAQALFEATLSILNPSPDAGHRSYQDIWLSVVGRYAIFPLERVRVASAERRDCRPSALDLRTAHAFTAPLPPKGWSWVLAIASALIFFALSEAVRRGYQNRRFLGIEWRQFTPWLSPHVDHSTSDGRAVHALSVFLPLAAAIVHLFLSGPYLHMSLGQTRLPTAAETPLLLPPTWHEVTFLLILLCPVSLLLTSGLLLTGLARRTWIDFRALHALGCRPQPEKKLIGRIRELARLLPSIPNLVIPFVLAFALVIVAIKIILSTFGMLGTNSVGLIFLLNRSLAFASGVSPLLPILFFLTIIVGWLLLSARRYQTPDDLSNPERHIRAARNGDAGAELGQGLYGKRLLSLIQEIRKATQPLTFWVQPHILLWTILLVLPCLSLSLYYGGTVGPLLRGLEHRSWDWSMSVLFVLGVILLIGSWLSLRRGRRALVQLFQQLTTINFSPSRDEEGAEYTWMRRLRKVVDISGRNLEELHLGRVEAFELLRTQVESERKFGASMRALRDKIRLSSRRTMDSSSFIQIWLAIAEWAREQGKGTVELKETGNQRDPGLLICAREFFVWQTACFARGALTQLAQLMAFLVGGLLLLLLGVSFYPFQPNGALTSYAGVLLVLGVVEAALFLIQVHENQLATWFLGRYRDESTSRRRLVGRLVLYGLLPLLSLAASVLPELGIPLSRSLEPLFRLLLQWIEGTVRSFV